MRPHFLAVWPQFEEALETIFQRSHLTQQTYMSTLTNVYNYCTNTYTILNYRNPTEAVAEDLVAVREFIEAKIEALAKKCSGMDGEQLLDFYISQWGLFKFSSTVANGCFTSFNNHWIIEDSKKREPVIYHLCLAAWKERLFDVYEEKIIGAVLDLIYQERTGSTINNRFISQLVVSLKELAGPQKLKIYKESFEKNFLKTTEEFYEKEMIVFLENPGNIKDYMKNVEKRLSEEESRVQLLLNHTTMKQLLICCENIMIYDQINYIQSHFGKLLAEKSVDDLARMYRLCSRIPDGLEFLRVGLQEHITKEGLDALEKVAQEAFNDPKIYMKTILEIYGKYGALIEQSFSKNREFSKCLDNATISFLNKNAVTMKAGQHGSVKSAELIARYCDQLFRKSLRIPDEIEMERMQKEVISIFRYLIDKDAFLKFYTKLFSKRLINGFSASDEAETSFISKLTQADGHEYTSRLTKMFQDIQVSKDLTMEYREKQTDSTCKSIDFNVKILSSGAWSSCPEFNLVLPQQLTSVIRDFKKYYDTKYTGRCLRWTYQLSRGEVTTTAFKGKKYVFSVTTPQMCTLLLFNEQSSYSVKKLQEATGMTEENTSTIVGSLVKNLILTSDKELKNEEVPLDATITLSTTYTNKKVRVDLSRMIRKENTEKEVEESTIQLDKERKHVIDACIVRIMKMRKQLMHTDLISEVITQLSSRFRPKVPQIKTAIGMLIDKEYLKRSDKQPDLYEYLA